MQVLNTIISDSWLFVFRISSTVVLLPHKMKLLLLRLHGHSLIVSNQEDMVYHNRSFNRHGFDCTTLYES